MSRRGGGRAAGLLVALSLVVVAVGATLVVLVATGRLGAAPSGAGAHQLEPASFSQYTWSELAEVARLIAEPASDEEGRAVAERYGVSVGDTRTLPLDDGRQATLTVVGIRSDERADGTGVAGLTLMASPIALRPMNDEPTCAGGWEQSELRAWLATTGVDLLPDELAEAVVSVAKLTNNVGVASDASALSETADTLWLFSASEVCGNITWFVDEYGSAPNAHTGYVDFASYDALLSGEGTQYEYFSSRSVSAASDPEDVLGLSYGGEPCAWWYRTPYPYTFTGDDASFFYQVMASGYPSSVGRADEPAGVACGLCL